MESRRGRPVWIRLTNVSDRTTRCYKHSSVVMWIPRGELPREVGYVRLNSNKYNERQVLAYAEGRDEALARKEKELYECWLAEQSRAVERRESEKPERILQRPTETSVAPDETRLQEVGSIETEIEAEIATGAIGDDDDLYEHMPNEMELADYAHELAFLPDLSEPSSSVLDYTGLNVVNESLSGDQQQKLVEVLKRHEKIMIASENALPPPAYGVVCDINPLRVLEKLYALLKGLLRAELITFLDSPWVSPIVIVLKKNGVDIRLCIDYKRVNAVTTIM
ncbi:hypothetical protein PHMEG_00024245 [Phytophthora megakarya]|uniref:Reverse transcriptase n=1 Tax=Phytophthora megakarya TaxID=4795 RepID=A0A225VEY5_9STRA|nr:hypothetical protein PHMEG_00024245 [Phytophthora megakarya]